MNWRRRTIRWLTPLLWAAACATRTAPATPAPRPLPPPLPDTTGRGIHVLASAEAPNGSVWVGTHGAGVWHLRAGAAEWVRVAEAALPSTIQALSATDSVVWWGSSSGGYGRRAAIEEESLAWEPTARVALNGIVVAGDTAWIATTRGLRIVHDARVVACLVASDAVVPAAAAPCEHVWRALPGDYLLAIARDTLGGLWLGDAHGVMHSRDGGASWRRLDTQNGLPPTRVRAIETSGANVWVATERALYHGNTGTAVFLPARFSVGGTPATAPLTRPVRALQSSPAGGWPAMALSNALLAPSPDGGPTYRSYGPVDAWGVMWWHRPLSPFAGTTSGLRTFLEWQSSGRTSPCDDSAQAWKYRCGRFPPAAARAEPPRHGVLLRPAGTDLGAPHIDPALAFGRDGARGITLMVPAGALVRSSGAGVVVRLDDGEAGTDVAVRHGATRGHVVTTVYRGLAHVRAAPGDSIAAGDTLGRVTQRGWQSPRLDWEVRLQPADAVSDTALGVAVNPHLWLMPHEGSGTIVGRVLDATGAVLRDVAIRGLTLESAPESPFGILHTYEPEVASDPLYDETFAITDVREGGYMLSVDIGARRIWRFAEVKPYSITYVVFQP